MIRLQLLILAVLVSACAQRPRVGEPLGDSTEESLRRAEAIGRALFHLDELSARGTDVLFAAVKTPDKPVQGYLALGEEKRVDFLANNGNEVVRFYSVDFSAEPAKLTTGTEDVIAGEEADMFRALTTARASAELPCERPYNTAVLRTPDAKGWFVYFLAASKEPSEVLIGGHLRATVDLAGKKVEALTPMSQSCLSLRKDAGPKGSSPAGLVFTHGGPLPTETHVFASLLHQTSLFVKTEQGGVWAVEEGRIRKVTD
jgi:hypothetical protein